MYYLLMNSTGAYCITNLSRMGDYDTSTIVGAIKDFHENPYRIPSTPVIKGNKFYWESTQERASYTILATSTQLDFTPQSHPELYV